LCLGRSVSTHRHRNKKSSTDKNQNGLHLKSPFPNVIQSAA
jgi:hypothetical protein